MNKDKVKDISEAISRYTASVMNRFTQLQTKQLTKYTSNPTEWKKKQMLDKSKFKVEVVREGAKATKELNKVITNGMILAYLSVDKNFDIKNIKVEEKTRQMALKSVKPLNKQVDKLIANVVKETNNQLTQQINRISMELNKATYQPNANKLYKTIVDTVNKYGGVKNVPKVQYSNGRMFDWNSYMDMNVRTTLSQETGNYQLKTGQDSGIVLWLCSEHETCAEDHLQFQGKVYYDRDYQNIITNPDTLSALERYIISNNLLSIQEVRDSDPFLTTRPNCRHYFEPISVEEALGSSTNSLLKTHDMYKGKGDQKKYQNLEQQRYNERMIRKWKQRQDQDLTLLKNATGEEKIKIQKSIDYDTHKISEWQKQQREFLKGKDYLDRDYNREMINAIRTDLGFKG